MTKTKAADAKKSLVAEYLELSETKLGLVYSKTDADDQALLQIIGKKSELVLKSNIEKLRKLADYDAAPIFTVAMPVTVKHGAANYTPKQIATPEGITDPQLKYFLNLCLEKHGLDLNDPKNSTLLEGAKSFTKVQAIKEISTLKGLPTLKKVAPVNAPAPLPTGTVAIPDGIYAIDHDGEPKCYEVSNGKAGTKWEGFIFLDRVSSDDKYSIRNRDERNRILDAIRTDVESSGRLAAQILRRCRGISENGRPCRRQLTDTKNPYFEMGYGPECGTRI